MNRSRVIVMVAAILAAGFAAFLVRGLLGGGTQKVKAAPVPPPIATSDVLVAATAIQAGSKVLPTAVRWQSWPKTSLDDTLITKDTASNLNDAVAGTVARTTLIAGEPITALKIVRADSASFMAAQLTPGMRAVSIKISAESGAGGFILPNDRVDIMMTTQISDSPRIFATHFLLKDIRVLAIGQTSDGTKDQKVALGGTATLELTPRQAEAVQRAEATGALSLTLRALGDSGANAKTLAAASPRTRAQEREDDTDGANVGGDVAVIRYGIAHANAGADPNRAGE